jgi:hypothetical protein
MTAPITAVTDLESLDRALQHMAMLQSRIAEVEATAAALHKRATEYEDAETEADSSELAGLTTLIEPFAREQAARQAAAGGRKEIRVPFGRVKVREQAPEIFREDERALSEWAAPMGYYRYPKVPEPVVDWARIVKEGEPRGERLVLPATGEVIPGCVVRERPESVIIEVAR